MAKTRGNMKLKWILIIALAFLCAQCARPTATEEIPTQTQTSVLRATDTSIPELTDTPIAIPTSTFTPLPTNTPNPTPIPAIFDEDFTSDILNWSNSPYSRYDIEGFEYTYSEKGLEFSYVLLPEHIYRCIWASPEKMISIDGDFEIEVKFDRRMRFSGVWFSHENPSYDNQFAVMTDQGVHSDDWTKEDAALGMLIPSEGDWTWLGERLIEPYIVEGDGVINLHLAFVDDQMVVTINGKEFTSDQNDMYSGIKQFRGIVVGNGDHFIVKSIRIWVEDEENLIFSSIN